MSAANVACYSCLLHWRHHASKNNYYAGVYTGFRCRTRLGRKSRKSKVKDKYKSKSRVKLNISLVKSLTAVADRPTVYVRVTPPCSVCVLVYLSAHHNGYNTNSANHNFPSQFKITGYIMRRKFCKSYI